VGREAGTSTGLTAGINALIGNPREDSLVASCQVMHDVESLVLVFLELF
jgi:hypothetical protein